MARRAALVFAFTALFAVDAWHYRGHLLDDAFISFRYAQHAVAGEGIVFNPGERVEGYTNPSWVALAAATLALGGDPVTTARVVSFAAALWVLALGARLERRQVDAALPLTPLLLLGSESFAYWSVGTLETSLFTALVLTAVAATAHECDTKRWRGSGLWFALAALTRPEGTLLFAAAWLTCAYRERTAATWRLLAVNAAGFGIVVGAHLAWRVGYYGALLPNTFDAKVTGGWVGLQSGLGYVAAWWLAFPVLGAALVAGAFMTRGNVARSSATMALAATLAITYAIWVVLAGGDFMPFYRFWLPILPLLALLVALGPLRARLARRPAWLAVGLALHALVAHAGDGRYHAFFAHRSTQWGLETGALLRDTLAPHDTIAVNTAGAIPYVSGLPAIDMLGLTDRTIAQRDVYVVSPGYGAHRRGHGAYVLERKPRAILWYNTTGDFEPAYLSDRELAASPVFRFFYRPRTATLRRPDADGAVLERLLGDPLGIAPARRARLPGLGIEVARIPRPLPHSTVHGAPVFVRWFELESRDTALWPERARLARDPADFVARTADHWARTTPSKTATPAQRARVQALCEDAATRLDAGEAVDARARLERAHAANTEARAACVYQLVARAALEAGELWSAVAAQKEALRVAPDDAEAARALVVLLVAPLPGGLE